MGQLLLELSRSCPNARYKETCVVRRSRVVVYVANIPRDLGLAVVGVRPKFQSIGTLC